LSAEELALWRKVAETVTPLRAATHPPAGNTGADPVAEPTVAPARKVKAACHHPPPWRHQR
jgi:hypothetical protein